MSYFSDHTWWRVSALINWTVIRTRLPNLRTLPSTTNRTSRSLPISLTSTALSRNTKVRVSRDNGKSAETGQAGDNVLCNLVAEILLLDVTAHVEKRQYGDTRIAVCVFM